MVRRGRHLYSRVFTWWKSTFSIFGLKELVCHFQELRKFYCPTVNDSNPPVPHQKPLVSIPHVFFPSIYEKGSPLTWCRRGGKKRRRWGRKDDRVEKWPTPKTMKGRDRRRTAGMKQKAGWIDERRRAQRFGKSRTVINYNGCRNYNYTSQRHVAVCTLTTV